MQNCSLFVFTFSVVRSDLELLITNLSFFCKSSNFIFLNVLFDRICRKMVAEICYESWADQFVEK